ncbi:MAG: glycosyltransferase family 4 protein, partial [Proteobacteria bacterium]|nr:glycosyltransferase family 4 protein [Pseudomonadota bacterium]
PINGGLPFPPGFQQAERQREWISGLRSVYRSIPFARSTYATAAAIVCGSSQTCREFSAYKEKVFFIPENGISPNMLENQRKKSNFEGELRLLFVGRLVPYKACDLAIKGAADLLAAGRAHLTIVGDGPDRHSLEALVLQLGLTARVTFTGILPHKETMQYFLAADILLFPSIREFGGGVVFEALASATVPLVADYGGPGDIIRDDIGFKIPLSHEADALVFIKSTLQELDSNRSRLHSLSQAGQIYARETLTWDGKALLMTRILNWTLGVSQKPNDLILD